MNFTDDEKRIIKLLFKYSPAKDRERVLENPSLADRHFKEAYKQFSTTDEIFKLFALRQKLDEQSQAERISARKISSGMDALLWIKEKAAFDACYPVHTFVVRNKQILISRPQNAVGLPVNIMVKSPVELAFYCRMPYSFFIKGRAISQTPSPWGPALEIEQLEGPFAYKQKGLSPFQYKVSKRTFPASIAADPLANKTGIKGSVTGLSIQGCTVRLPLIEALHSGGTINLELELPSGIQEVSAKIERLNLSPENDTTLCKTTFTRLSRRASNIINAAVYEY
ncbi:MAG: PilZ domain-containing protein [Spirochaetaceae bacterium]|jgi:hypothetical protein|nr:PilZ domain-containing protein [Spirochaetaceae bacterium]